MGNEVDLLINYPRTLRNIHDRAQNKTEQDRMIARQFGKDFFDGDRKYGYGGFNYHPKYWQPVVPTFQDYYSLTSEHNLLDVGCAKGFMLYDFFQIIPGIQVSGLDISSYAVENSLDAIRPFLQLGDARKLPYADHTFDLVISINTIHNLEEDEVAIALTEIQRVSKKFSYITVDAYRTAEEKERMYAWNLTAKTIKSVEEWKLFFKKVGYQGDYYWFVP